MERADVLIIGSGIAALQLAKKLRSDTNVKILTKSTILEGNSALAQGGIAAAISENDDPYKHYLDTMEAGRNHNNGAVVSEMTKAAPSLIKELFQEGCSFDTDHHGKLRLGMEGAHSEKRIVHGGGDATGKTIMDFLVNQMNKVTVVENMTVFDLIMVNQRCVGVKGKYDDGRVEYFYADHTVLATGGIGQLYSFTPCAETITGDGLALAYRAGAEIADMEFVQFHPTLLFVDNEGKGLISEAVRGEGAKLVTEDGKKIMEGVHPLKDLGPRHIVAQTIYSYLRQGDPVYLDISGIPNFEQRFPTVSELCRENHVDLSKGKLPVVPGCHFLMGGIKTDKYGKTNLKGLYAIGEVACTGIHGANRLASNSLLEGLFFGKNLADWLNGHVREGQENPVPLFSVSGKRVTSETSNLPERLSIKTMMMDYAGIVRTKEGLTKQKNWLEGFDVEGWVKKDLESLSIDQITRAFMLITSWLVTSSALERTESRGGHFRGDFPEEDNHNWLKKQIIHRRLDAKDEGHEQVKTAANN